MKTYINFAGFTVGLVVLLLLAFSILQWLHVPAGNFLDWVIGGVTFWWLLLIVTVPWNIHFEAKEVLAEAEESRKKNIKVEEEQIKYVKAIAKSSLIAAIVLHFLSTIGLYALAIFSISAVGYVGSAAALLLTILRPAVRFYQYLAVRLSMIRREFRYPREDIEQLRNRFDNLEIRVTEIEEKLNLKNPNSWAAMQEQYRQKTEKDLTRLATAMEDLKVTNQAEHLRLEREAQNAISQLSADAQFLDRVREIIRFFKEA